MQKMKEEANRHKELELKRTREIAQLRKESRKRENEIRTLQMDKRVKETVLKRKQEEVNALRKVQARQGNLSDRAAGRVVPGTWCFKTFSHRFSSSLLLLLLLQAGIHANRASPTLPKWLNRNGTDWNTTSHRWP